MSRGRRRHRRPRRARLPGAERLRRRADHRHRRGRGAPGRSSSTAGPPVRDGTRGHERRHASSRSPAPAPTVAEARARAYAAVELHHVRGRPASARDIAAVAEWLSPTVGDPGRLRVRPRAHAGGARRARRARDRLGVRGALGAPDPGRRRRVRQVGSGPRAAGADLRRRARRGAARASSRLTPSCR